MMDRLLALSMFLFLSITRQVASEGCCTFEQYETSFVGSAGYRVPKFLEAGNLRIFYRQGVDHKLRRVGRYLHVEQLPSLEKQDYQFFLFFDTNEQYLVKDGVCSKHALPQKYEPKRCVPEGSKFVGSSSLGNDNIQVDSWRKQFDSKGVGGDLYGTWTHKDCIPVFRSFISVQSTERGPVSFVTDGNFMNFTEGIKERDRWFNLPSSCQNITVKSTDSTLGLLQKWILLEEGSSFL